MKKECNNGETLAEGRARHKAFREREGAALRHNSAPMTAREFELAWALHKGSWDWDRDVGHSLGKACCRAVLVDGRRKREVGREFDVSVTRISQLVKPLLDQFR